MVHMHTPARQSSWPPRGSVWENTLISTRLTLVYHPPISQIANIMVFLGLMPVHILVQCCLFITTDLSTQMIQLNSKSQPHNNAQVSAQHIHYSACTILLAPHQLLAICINQEVFP